MIALTLTQERKQEIKARLAAAAPGPWQHRDADKFGTVALSPKGKVVLHGLREFDDLELCAHAPADIADLLAEVERLETAMAVIEENARYGAEGPLQT